MIGTDIAQMVYTCFIPSYLQRVLVRGKVVALLGNISADHGTWYIDMLYIATIINRVHSYAVATNI